MAGLFAPVAGNWIEQRILEFLRYNRFGASKKTAAQTEPFEIAIMITDNNPALIWRKGGIFLQFDVTEEVFAGEPRAPHQVEHGLGEMLIRFANDAVFFCSRIFLDIGAVEIRQRNAVTITNH